MDGFDVRYNADFGRNASSNPEPELADRFPPDSMVSIQNDSLPIDSLSAPQFQALDILFSKSVINIISEHPGDTSKKLVKRIPEDTTLPIPREVKWAKNSTITGYSTLVSFLLVSLINTAGYFDWAYPWYMLLYVVGMLFILIAMFFVYKARKLFKSQANKFSGRNLLRRIRIAIRFVWWVHLILIVIGLIISATQGFELY